MIKKKEKYSRLFIYKAYKIMCKMLGADAICYGKVTKNSKNEIIYVDNGRRKYPLLWKKEKGKHVNITIHGNANKNDIQKAIVLRVLRAIETGDVYVFFNDAFIRAPIIKKDTCFEEKVIEMDLNYEAK